MDIVTLDTLQDRCNTLQAVQTEHHEDLLVNVKAEMQVLEARLFMLEEVIDYAASMDTEFGRILNAYKAKKALT
jgi:hypothetical protein